MAPMQSVNSTYTREEQDLLKVLAFRSVEYGLRHGVPIPANVQDFSKPLQQVRASFVTLERNGLLRGCIGTLDAKRPLVADVARNAFNAAFHDTRFQPLDYRELDELDFHISVLSPKEPMTVSSEQDLLTQLRPGTDGLVIEWKNLGATFLPVMWEQLPNPVDFLSHLKRKAGIHPATWEPDFQFYRYTAEDF